MLILKCMLNTDDVVELSVEEYVQLLSTLSNHEYNYVNIDQKIKYYSQESDLDHINVTRNKLDRVLNSESVVLIITDVCDLYIRS